mmetsp:Transcript_28987/g.55538  ORF Transcript_28987/g.55538 Transcript_28987/m.55538 type:complete len:389 (-) Transcript_28987:572-1738(-)
MPDGIHSKSIRGVPLGVEDGARLRGLLAEGEWQFVVGGAHVVRGAEERHGHGEELVVQHAGVHAEDAHQQDAVAPREHHVEDFVVDVRELLLVGAQESRREKHHGAVTQVSEHHREEEGEGDDGEHRRVYLAIAGNAVRVHNVLEHLRHLVGLEKSGGGLFRLKLLENRVHLGGALVGGALDGGGDARAHHDGAPPLRHQALLGDVHAELVEGVIHRLLAAHLHDPVAQVHRDLAEHRLSLAGASLQRHMQLPQTRIHLGVHGALAGAVLRERVAVRAHRLAKLEDLAARALAGEEHHEHRLLHLVAREGVLHQAVDVRQLEEHVAPGGSEQHALERRRLVRLHQPRDQAEARRPRRAAHPPHLARLLQLNGAALQQRLLHVGVVVDA